MIKIIFGCLFIVIFLTSCSAAQFSRYGPFDGTLHATSGVICIPFYYTATEQSDKFDQAEPNSEDSKLSTSQKIVINAAFGTIAAVYNITDFIFTVPTDLVLTPIFIFSGFEENEKHNQINHFKLWDCKNYGHNLMYQ